MRKRYRDAHRIGGNSQRSWRKFYKARGGCRWSAREHDALSRAEAECREAVSRCNARVAKGKDSVIWMSNDTEQGDRTFYAEGNQVAK